MGDQALSDMKVIDLTHYLSGPACTKLLATYGADVIKIERPGTGDGARHLGPFYKDDPHPEKSGLFLYLNINKRGVTLNLKSQLGKEIFREMVKKADVVVESFKPGVMDRLGLGYEELEKLNPKLVMTSISNFGQTGPYRDYKLTEMIAFGLGGPMNATGLGEREPLKYGGTIATFHSGMVAAMYTMVAFYASRYLGIGQHVDISIVETQAGTIDRRFSGMVTYQYAHRSIPRGAMTGAQYPRGVYPCADGYFVINAVGDRMYRSMTMIGDPPEFKDPKWHAPGAPVNPALKEEFEAIFLAWTMQRTKKEIFEIGQKTGNAVAPLYAIDEVVHDPQFNQRGFFVEVDHPVTGKLKYPGRPFVMVETPSEVRRPAPLLGQHNLEVYSELGYSQQDLVLLRETGII